MFKWSPDFDASKETSLAPIWVFLPKLNYHLFNWDYLKQILTQIGTPLKEDIATIITSRPNLAKVTVEVDLLKPMQKSVWFGKE